MSYEHNHDRIIYVLYDDQAVMVAAHFDKGEALAQIKRASASLTMDAKVVDVSARRKAILDSFDPMDRLIMDPPQRDQKRRDEVPPHEQPRRR